MPGLDFVPFLDRLAATDLGTEAASRYLREQGLSFTQSTFREYYRSAQLRQQLGGLVEGLPERIPIPLRSLELRTIHGGEPFMSTIRVEGTDLRTGEPVTRFVNVLHETIPSKQQAIDAIFAAPWYERGDSLQGINVRSFAYEGGYLDVDRLRA